MQRAGLEAKVQSKLSPRVIASMLRFLQEQRLPFWSEEQNVRTFVKQNLLLTLYKDLYNVGFQKVLREFDVGFVLSNRSFQHNTSLIRTALKQWSLQHIVFGDRESWIGAARRVSKGKEFSTGLLWIDSTDFATQRIAGEGKSSAFWSYKENHFGRRFMFVRDGRGKIIKIWGGYSPKVYDSDFLAIQQEFFQEKFKDVGLFADQHFEYAQRMFGDVTIFTPVKKPASRKKSKSGEGTAKLTKQQEAYNHRLRAIRARVETPFGWMKQKFESLAHPWAGASEQLDCLVFIASAVYNEMK